METQIDKVLRLVDENRILRDENNRLREKRLLESWEIDEASFKFFGFGVKELRSAIYFAQGHGWKETKSYSEPSSDKDPGGK